MTLKIHLSQINTTVGDLAGNCQKILREFKKAESENCDLVIFCEMTICGYPAQDLWLKKYFIAEIEEKIIEIMEAAKNSKCAILLGAPTSSTNRVKKEIISNSAILIEKGKVIKVCNKKTLANQGVFDEKRYFEPEPAMSFVEFRGFTLAILICEDLWDAKNLFLLKEQVFDLIISLNSSPYSVNKQQDGRNIDQNFTKTLNKSLIYFNQVGGQDSLVFDGDSFVMNEAGEIVLKMKVFEEDFGIVEIEKDGLRSLHCHPAVVAGSINKLGNNYNTCIIGLRDYIQKNGFKKVLLGMSGGIDSALVATMAVDALGSENVSLYALPSRYNSETSMIDAKECAKNLAVNLEVISIEEPFKAMLKTLGNVSGLTEENLQSRIRGNILMALSNNSGALLLSTGNKSELACGYATLYGDMCGAFNPIKDLYKTEIFELAKWRNENAHEILRYTQDDGSDNCHPERSEGSHPTKPIPQNIITKAPTAELRPNQKDSDSLPEYEILDKILFALIEEQKSITEIIKLGFENSLVKKVAKLFYASEYKRQQSCIGPKISEMSFDKDRRYPITNKSF